MKWFDRVWSEREGMVKQRDRDGIKEEFCQCSVFKKGTQCKRTRLVGERIKLTVIREKWLQIKKIFSGLLMCSTNCSPFDLLHFHTAVPLHSYIV